MKPAWITQLQQDRLRDALMLPAAPRAVVLRELAQTVGDEKTSLRLAALAADLEAIDAKHKQLVLDFNRRSAA